MTLRVLVGSALALLLGCGGTEATEAKFTRPAPIPPVLAPTSVEGGVAQYDLQAQAGTTEFLRGKPTETYGYNGAILGPTLRLQRGQGIQVTLRNALPESDHDHTNLHWHGLKVHGDVDIVPKGSHGLHPGKSVTVTFTPDQPAGTLWYHPHPHGHTGIQVQKGMAGFLLLEDGSAEALDLPRTYGVDDLPLVVQDRRLNPDGSMAYMETMGDKDFMMGDAILVNGVVSPFLEVPAGRVRLRLLNGSSTRRYRFALGDRRTFHMIASDGGLLEAPLPMQDLMLGPAERAEILVDFSRDLGRSLFLRSEAFEAPKEERDAGQGVAFPVLQLRITKPGTPRPLPPSLAPVTRIPEAEATRTRVFLLEDTEDGVINGRHFDHNRVDETVVEGATEIWEVENRADVIAHPFHIHGGQFLLLSRNGAEPAPEERGWKDTFLVNPLERIRIILRFKDLRGRYMYHCHILEHEDGGMMGQFEVVP